MSIRKLIAVAAVIAASAVFPMAALSADKAVSGTYRLSADEDWTAYDTVTFTGGTTVDLAGHTLAVSKFGCTGLATTNDIAAGYAGLAHLETDGGQYVVLSDYDPAADDRVGRPRVRPHWWSKSGGVTEYLVNCSPCDN